MDLLQAMAIFRRVAESTSFSAVAREQGLSQPTVSKQVAFLEERLDTKLLSYLCLIMSCSSQRA